MLQRDPPPQRGRRRFIACHLDTVALLGILGIRVCAKHVSVIYMMHNGLGKMST